MCDFQKLAFSEHGYIVRCVDCGYLQLAFGTTMLTLNHDDFHALYDMVKFRLSDTSVNEKNFLSDDTKGIFIPTPSANCCIVLTVKELQHFYRILDKADNEMKALSLLQLFGNK
ncbi:DUF6686 family protein [Parafilimonas sp.]|uniref:DUF6686 family protein n=1 Tax=Parafilimonas sp. TaxID=1969739 RepID=UPI0039E25F52